MSRHWSAFSSTQNTPKASLQPETLSTSVRCSSSWKSAPSTHRNSVLWSAGICDWKVGWNPAYEQLRWDRTQTEITHWSLSREQIRGVRPPLNWKLISAILLDEDCNLWKYGAVVVYVGFSLRDGTNKLLLKKSNVLFIILAVLI